MAKLRQRVQLRKLSARDPVVVTCRTSRNTYSSWFEMKRVMMGPWVHVPGARRDSTARREVGGGRLVLLVSEETRVSICCPRNCEREQGSWCGQHIYKSCLHSCTDQNQCHNVAFLSLEGGRVWQELHSVARASHVAFVRAIPPKYLDFLLAEGHATESGSGLAQGTRLCSIAVWLFA